MVLFAEMRHMNWAQIRINRSAVRAWHAANDLLPELNNSWDFKVNMFWRGLKECALHTNNHKREISLDELFGFIDHRKTTKSLASVRDAALAAFLFFGIRRINEGINLRRCDISDKDGHLQIYIHRQKNDTEGCGHTIWIPDYGLNWAHNPADLIRQWISEWDFKYESSQPTTAPLFCTTKAVPKHLSYDSCRKTVACFFKQKEDVATHGFRRGGAQFLANDLHLDENLVQHMGGWADASVMSKFYAYKSVGQKRQISLDAFAQAAESLSKPNSPADDPTHSPDVAVEESAPEAPQEHPKKRRRRLDIQPSESIVHSGIDID